METEKRLNKQLLLIVKTLPLQQSFTSFMEKNLQHYLVTYQQSLKKILSLIHSLSIFSLQTFYMFYLAQ